MIDNDGFEALGDWRVDAPLTGALIIPVDGEGRVLLQLRDYATSRYPGCWGFFGGKVEDGETLKEAALREFREEAGLALKQDALIPAFRLTSPEARSNLYIFTAAIDAAPRDIRLGEGAGFAFVAPKDFPRLDMALITEIVLAAWVERGVG